MMQRILTHNLLTLIDMLSSLSGRSRRTTLRTLVQMPHLLDRLEAGEGFNISTYDEVLQACSNHWPAGLIWPADIDRPTPKLIGVGGAPSVASARPEQ